MLTPGNLRLWRSVVVAGSDSGVLQFTYKGLKSEWVDSFRYLGVIFSRSCCFDLCVDTLTKSGQKAIMAMLNRAHLLGGLDIDIKCRLFNGSNIDIWL